MATYWSHDVHDSRSKYLNMRDLQRLKLASSLEEEKKYVISLPEDSERIYFERKDASSTHFLMMYASLFTRLQVSLPFTDFQIGLMNRLKLAPSQLHPNSWGYISTFEFFCKHHKLEYTVPLFLHIFTVIRRLTERSWVSLRRNVDRDIMTPYTDSFKGFKVEWFKISCTEGHSFFFVNEDQSFSFPPYWTREHYNINEKDFYVNFASLSDEEKATMGFLDDWAYLIGSIKCKALLDHATKAIPKYLDDLVTVEQNNILMERLEKRRAGISVDAYPLSNAARKKGKRKIIELGNTSSPKHKPTQST